MFEVVADAEHRSVAKRPRDARREGGKREAERSGLGSNGQALPDTDRGACDGRTDEPIGGSEEREASERNTEVDWGVYEAAIRHWEAILGRQAPPPTETGPKGNARLSPRFVEWMMGLPDGWVTDLGFARKDLFRLLGNGVVPLQAALAVKGLMDEEIVSRSDVGLAA